MPFDRRCSKPTCMRPLKGHKKPTGDKCQLPPRVISPDELEEINRKPRNKDRTAKSRKRLSSDAKEEIKLKDRKRNNTLNALSRKKKHHIGWCDPNIEEKPVIKPLVLSKMEEMFKLKLDNF